MLFFPIGTMSASTAAAISPPQMVLFGKNHQSFFVEIVISRQEGLWLFGLLFGMHNETQSGIHYICLRKYEVSGAR